MPPVAKAKKKIQRQAEIAELISPKAARKAERKLRNYIMELDERSEEREVYTQSILAVNDRSVLETVGAIAESLKRMSNQREPVITLDGQTYTLAGAEAELVAKIQMRNWRYIAMRLLVACAEWNIRVGNFNLPDDSCARCGKEMK